MAGAAGRLIALAGAAALIGAAAGASSDPARTLAGRVSASFPDGLVDGSSYTGENIAEIVPVAPGAAYVRIHLDYYNGHQCGIAGVATAQGDALVYRDAAAAAGEPRCVLSLRHAGRALRIDDAGGSCKGYCGARGTLSDVAIPWASHRPITYLARLRASARYRDALAEWRRGGGSR